MGHEIKDQDLHFLIDPVTRSITNQTAAKAKLIQFDHNSERFTFEVPRFVDGHDMSLCTKVEVHYINVAGDKQNQKADVYPADDVAVVKTDNGEVVTFSWLISRNATQYAGTLNFLVRFSCLTGSKLDYVWNTAIFSGINIAAGMDNGETVIEDYSDVLEAWKRYITAAVADTEELRALAADAEALKRDHVQLLSRVSFLEEVNKGHTYNFQTVKDVAVKHAVPARALSIAQLESIGGYTRKSKNLLKLPPNKEFGAQVSGGATITFRTDENGYLCIDSGGGYADEPVGFYLSGPLNVERNNITISARYISGEVVCNGEEWGRMRIDDSEIELPTRDNPVVTYTTADGATRTVELAVLSGISFSNYKIALQIEEGTTATDFEPYFEGLKSAKVTAIKSRGANLLPYPYTNTTTYCDGITFTDNGDGSITANGTATNTAFFVCNQGMYLPAGQYHISSHTNLGSSAQLRWGIDAYETSFTSTGETKSVEIRIANGTTLNNVVFKPMLNIGTTALPYEPYVDAVDTYVIPQELQALDGYGVGINATNTNGIDFETKTFKKCVKELVLTGSEQMSTWAFNNVKGVMFPNVLDVTLNRSDGVCTDAEVSTSANISTNELWIGLDNRVVYWCGVLDALNMTESDFREYTRARYNSGDPIRILYPSSTCEKTDVSAHIPDTVYLKVEAGGYIVGENEDGTASNLGITYQVKIA